MAELVRLYRGEGSTSADLGNQAGLWFTTSLESARDYAARPDLIRFVDVPPQVALEAASSPIPTQFRGEVEARRWFDPNLGMEFRLPRRWAQRATWLESEPAPADLEVEGLGPAIDTATAAERAFGNAGYVEDGELLTYHVTDDPERVIRALERGLPIAETRDVGKYGDIGPGLYVSATPQLWTGRARSKWDFLQDMSPSRRQRLADAIADDRALRPEERYVTSSEREYAHRILDEFVRDGKSWRMLVDLSGQPYNIRFWEPRFLKPLEISPGPQPQVIEVRLRGRFKELLGNHGIIAPELVERLQEAGVDGIFERGGMMSTPQLVVWNNSAVVRFDGWAPGLGPAWEQARTECAHLEGREPWRECIERELRARARMSSG